MMIVPVHLDYFFDDFDYFQKVFFLKIGLVVFCIAYNKFSLKICIKIPKDKNSQKN